MIVALARKLLIALWRLVTTGEASAASSGCLTEVEAKQCVLQLGLNIRLGRK
jgi:hypothetical protein